LDPCDPRVCALAALHTDLQATGCTGPRGRTALRCLDRLRRKAAARPDDLASPPSCRGHRGWRLFQRTEVKADHRFGGSTIAVTGPLFGEPTIASSEIPVSRVAHPHRGPDE
jgi:hypothetical protein